MHLRQVRQFVSGVGLVEHHTCIQDYAELQGDLTTALDAQIVHTASDARMMYTKTHIGELWCMHRAQQGMQFTRLVDHTNPLMCKQTVHVNKDMQRAQRSTLV